MVHALGLTLITCSTAFATTCTQINVLGLTPNRYYPALTSGRFVITNLAGVTAFITTDTLGLGLLGNQRLFDVSSFYLTGIFTDHDLLMVDFFILLVVSERWLQEQHRTAVCTHCCTHVASLRCYSQHRHMHCQ